ncbi:MAG: hypothetical protein AB1698_17890 [Pseudomonadota bacterium]|jgi:hypothetical protein|nr:hypothetical protein [Hyphomicrobiales bacterium]
MTAMKFEADERKAFRGDTLEEGAQFVSMTTRPSTPGSGALHSLAQTLYVAT